MNIRIFNKNFATFACLTVAFVVGMSVVEAATYTWTQDATGSYDWTTPANWDGSGVFASGSGDNELMFFADTSSYLSPDNANITITNVPSLSMNTLTLNGKGPNGARRASFLIGDNTSTWTIGDGTTSLINLNTVDGGGHAGELDDIRWTIAPNFKLNQTTTTFTGNGDVHEANFAGNITESAAGYGITKSGSSWLTFSGVNTYSGTTTVSGGTLRLNSATALPGGIGTTGGTSALTLNGGVLDLASGDFSRGLGAGSDQFQIPGGTSGFGSRGAHRVVTVNGDASQELQWGSTYFAPSALVLNEQMANNVIELTNRIDLNAATRTVKVDGNKALISNDIRTTSGTAGLTKTGNGTLVLTGNNTYNGDTTISGGTLSVGATSNFGGGGSGLIMNTATLQIRGTALTSLSGLGSTVTINSGNKGFDIQDAANTFTVDEVLDQGGSSLTKSGVGTLVLNQDNTFTGNTTATGGGTLVLDYSANNGSKLSDSKELILYGSNLVLKGGSHTEAVSKTYIGVNNGISVGNSISRDGGTSKISLGPLSIYGYSNLGISEANLATTTTGNTNGILYKGRVTVGNDFGANDGSGNIVAHTGYTTATTAGGGNKDTDVNQLTGGGTMTGDLQSYSLKIANSGNSDILDLTNKRLLLYNNGTLLYAGGGDNQYTINGTTGYINSASGNQPFIINTYAGTTLTVNAQLGQNYGGFSKAGEGTLVVGAANAKLATTKYIQQGVLRLTNGGGLGTNFTKSQATIVQGGAALELSNTIAVGAETLDLNGAGISNGGALRNVSGDNSWAGGITIGASGARINSDAGTLTITGGIATTLAQDVTFGGASDTTVSTTAISGAGSLIKDGAGTLTLSADNTYTGGTTITDGTLVVSGSGDINQTSGVTIGSGATFRYNSNVAYAGGSITNDGGTIGGTGTILVPVTLDSTSDTLAPGNSPGVQGYAASQSWNSFTYDWEINDFDGTTAGTDFDQIQFTDGAALTLTGTTGSYILNLTSLEGVLNTAGDVADFSETTTSWDILTTTGGITGFDASYWTIETGGFTSSPAWQGTWSLGQVGNDLVLTYTIANTIPEPSTIILAGLGLLGVCSRRRRRK